MSPSGTFNIVLKHPDADWMTNNQEYKFGPFGDGETLDFVVFKYSDRSLEARIAFEHHSHTFSGRTDFFTTTEPSLLCTWTPDEIKFFVEGAEVFSAPFSPARH